MTALPTRHFFDSMDGLAMLQRIDPTSVQRSAMFYAGCAAFFAFGGLSFDVSRRLGARAQALVRETDPDEILYERAMRFAARVLEGDWDDAHEIEPERLEDSLRRGQLWGPTTYLGLFGEKLIHRGRFEEAQRCVEQIDEIRDLFRFDLATTNYYYLRTLLPLERGDLAGAIEAADAYYDHTPEDLLHILALSAKAKAQVLLGDLAAAEIALGLAEDLMASSAPVPPFHASAYHRSRLLFDVAGLEQASQRSAGSAAPRARALPQERADGAAQRRPCGVETHGGVPPGGALPLAGGRSARRDGLVCAQSRSGPQARCRTRTREDLRRVGNPPASGRRATCGTSRGSGRPDLLRAGRGDVSLAGPRWRPTTPRERRIPFDAA